MKKENTNKFSSRFFMNFNQKVFNQIINREIYADYLLHNFKYKDAYENYKQSHNFFKATEVFIIIIIL